MSALALMPRVLAAEERPWNANRFRFLRTVFEAEATASSVLVLADAYYTGWSATVDGKPSAILPTNVAGRGVLLERGSHDVVFRYHTPGLFWALVVSAGTLLIGGAIGVGQDRFRLRAQRRGAPG